MAKQEITLQGLDGQLDELILTTNDETANGKLEDCARMLFPQEGETTCPAEKTQGTEKNRLPVPSAEGPVIRSSAAAR